MIGIHIINTGARLSVAPLIALGLMVTERDNQLCPVATMRTPVASNVLCQNELRGWWPTSNNKAPPATTELSPFSILGQSRPSATSSQHQNSESTRSLHVRSVLGLKFMLYMLGHGDKNILVRPARAHTEGARETLLPVGSNQGSRW